MIDKKKKLKLLSKKNVVSVGLGYKIKDGKKTNDLCLSIGVVKKVEKRFLNKRDLVPSTIEGIKTDVVKVGHIKAFYPNPTSRIRPAVGGISIGHKDITAGTLGTIVKNKEGQPLILSNNHVLANSNDAAIGDPILQPGPYDGGTENDVIANLLRFVPIKFVTNGEPNCDIANAYIKFGNYIAKMLKSNYRVKLYIDTDNRVDAAVALPISDDIVEDSILVVGEVKDISLPYLGMKLHKFGRTTEYTEGEVLQLDATVNVNYGGSSMAVFVNQIIAGPMSAGGDSGSLVVAKDNNNAVGLLFAGSDKVTVMNPIVAVLDSLEINI